VLTDKDTDDGSQAGPLLEQVEEPVASFTGDGAYDRDEVYTEVTMRGPANSPPEAGSNRHLRPVNSPPLTAGTEPLGEAEPSLTNNPIWQA